jgi:vesicle transport through interaction with t-SNAREs protein 1
LQRDSQRSDLLGNRGTGGKRGHPGYSDEPYSDDPSGYDRDQRGRLLAGTETLNDGSRRLENAHRIALETEDVGADILRNLRGQRDQIEHTRDTVSHSVRR